MFCVEIKIKQGLSMSFCSLRILYKSKLILIATFLGNNAVVMRVHWIFPTRSLPITSYFRLYGGHTVPFPYPTMSRKKTHIKMSHWLQSGLPSTVTGNNILHVYSGHYLHLMPGKLAADYIFTYFSLFFLQKKRFDILCKLSPWETISMKCQP